MTNDYECIDDANSMTSQDWDEVDRSSRNLLSCYLTATNATDIGETHGNCCIDLSCVCNGKKVAVEVKDRAMPHDKFGDILVEDLKQDATSRRISNGQFDAALAVNVFTDNIIAIASLYDKDAKHFQKYAPATTLVKNGDHTFIKKHFTSLPQRRKVKFEATPAGWRFQNI